MPKCGQETVPVTPLTAAREPLTTNRCLSRPACAIRVFVAADALAGFVEQGENLEEAVARELFEEAGVTAGPVCSVADLLNHPYTSGREALVELEDDDLGSLPMHNIIPRLSVTPGGFRRPAPRLGEHTDEILAEVLHTRDDKHDPPAQKHNRTGPMA